ncbi:MAG: PKD domain-containing protein, partial [Bacteroidota bacterium]
PEADFEMQFDSCLNDPIAFFDQSRPADAPIETWQWRFADEGFSNEINPFYTFERAGIRPIQLSIIDTNQCQSQITQEVSWFPLPNWPLSPATIEGCTPYQHTFDWLEAPVDEQYQIFWSFGDGESSTEVRPIHDYDQRGFYQVSVDITSPSGCASFYEVEEAIWVHPSPRAAFGYSPEEISNLAPEVQFFDESDQADFWQWDFNGLGSSNLANPIYTFPDTGLQRIELIVRHEEGCRDTSIQWLDVAPLVRYYLPNAFTPNGDARNDFFLGKGILEGMNDFNFQIWNRWGTLIFETDDPMEGWDGRYGKAGQKAPKGVYVYLVTYKGPRGQVHYLKGFATLVR